MTRQEGKVLLLEDYAWRRATSKIDGLRKLKARQIVNHQLQQKRSCQNTSNRHTGDSPEVPLPPSSG